MNRGIDLKALMAVMCCGVMPAYASVGETDSFGSVFIVVFCAYCALIVVSHLVAFLRLKLFNEGAVGKEEPAKAFEET